MLSFFIFSSVTLTFPCQDDANVSESYYCTMLDLLNAGHWYCICQSLVNANIGQRLLVVGWYSNFQIQENIIALFSIFSASYRRLSSVGDKASEVLPNNSVAWKGFPGVFIIPPYVIIMCGWTAESSQNWRWKVSVSICKRLVDRRPHRTWMRCQAHINLAVKTFHSCPGIELICHIFSSYYLVNSIRSIHWTKLLLVYYKNCLY